MSERKRLSYVVGLLGLLTAGGAVLRTRLFRRQREAVLQPVPPRPIAPTASAVALTSPAVSLPSISEQKTSPRPVVRASPLRWLAFLLAFVGVAVVLVVLQNSDSSVSTALFALMVVGGLGIGIYKYPGEIRDGLRSVPRQIQGFAHWLSRYRIPLGIAAGALGIGLILQASSSFVLAGAKPELITTPLRMLLAGTLILGAALLLNPPSIPLLNTFTLVRNPPTRIRWRSVIIGLLALLVLAEINGNVFHIFPDDISYNLQIGLLVFGILALIWGFGSDWRWPHLGRLEALGLLVVVLLAFVLRVVVLEISLHRFVDEMNFINAVVTLWDHPSTRILTPFSSVTAFTWLYPYLQSLSVAAFGHNLSAIRLVSSLFGTLTIPALYFLARTLFDRTTAFVAALLLATFPAHMHFSRIGLNNIADPLVGTIGLAFLARAWKSNRRSDYVIAGVALGLTQYFYEGGRLLFPALAVGWFALIWLTHKDKRARRNALLTLLITLLIAAPVYYTTLATQGTLTPRLNSTALSLKDWVDLFTTTSATSLQRYEHFAYPFLTYISLPDQGWFYGGYQPMILSGIIPAFLLGLALIVWRLRAPGPLLILLWLLGTSLGNMLLRENDWTPRYVVVFPALALLIALGLRYGPTLIWPSRFRPRWQMLAILLLTGVVAVAQVNYYFNEHLPIISGEFRAPKDIDDMYFRLPDIPPNTQVHVIFEGSIFGFNFDTLIRFWNLNITADSIYPVEVTDQYLSSLPASSAQAFFINPNDVATLTRIRMHFHLLPPRFSPFDVPSNKQLAMYYAPRFNRP